MISRIMLKRVLLAGVAAIVVGTVGFGLFAYRPSIAVIARPAASNFAPALVAQGEVLASAGYCSACHTAKGGPQFSGGYSMTTQFGTIYSTNITPDAETGIGGWSEVAFRRAMHEGVSRDGGHLFPAFPYDHFTKLSDADVTALYAYFMTRDAVRQEATDNTVLFPLNFRILQAGWKLLFFKPGRYDPDPVKDAAWNRGAYLVQGISHCGACHTPRNAFGAERRSKMLTGAEVDHWIAPPLDQTNPAPVAWSQDELVAYLGKGISLFHGTAFGPMGEIPHGLAELPAADVQSMATYLVSISGSATRAAQTPALVRKALDADVIGTGLQYDAAARLYAGACTSCHYNGGQEVNPLRPDLALNSAVTMDDPRNLIRVILYGVNAKDGAPGIVMPGFEYSFTDADVARIAAYLRATRTSVEPWSDLAGEVATIRAEGQGQ